MAIYGIKAVKYCLSKNLLHYVEADAGGGQTQDIEVFNPATGQCTVTNPLTVLPCLVGSKATLTVDDAVVNRRHQFTARLTFVTADNPNLDGEYYAFVVETNEGEQMLLGSKVAPRCSVTTRQNVAATAGDINGYTTTVDFKAPYAPLRLPVTTEPVTDTREFDICCGAIAQPQQPDTREFDVCCGQIAQPPVPDTREFDVCCGEIKGEVPPTPIPTRVLCPATSSEEGKWLYIYKSPNNELHDGLITDTRDDTKLPIVVDPSAIGYTDFQIFLKEFGRIINIDLSPMAPYRTVTPVKDILDTNAVIGYTGPTWPSDKVAIIYAYDQEVAGVTTFVYSGIIWPKNSQIPDPTVYPNPSGKYIARAGYHCVGWAYRPGGTAVTLGNATQHVVLYALWVPNE